MAVTSKSSSSIESLVKQAKAARQSKDETASALIKSAVQAMARSEAAATEARILAGFINDM